ncbi:hypothetical protein PR048_026653 [Dryococelus australis]|uniref:Uncharacterized protein n=1 Tax=Dryococelus australis TaxID=614101 RepID=A0ABQ9GM03_9NEOP|nr:hypothetical protein PR048_026653 [Dryococelus australis]
MTPRQLYEWTKTDIHTIYFAFSTVLDYEQETNALKERFSNARQVPGTQKLNCIIPNSKHRIVFKPFSFSRNSKEEDALTDTEDLDFEAIVGFVTCIYNDQWSLACVIDTNEEKQEFKVSFLAPHGPSPSFTYLWHPDILTVTSEYILTKVDPITATGNRLIQSEMKEQVTSS